MRKTILLIILTTIITALLLTNTIAQDAAGAVNQPTGTESEEREPEENSATGTAQEEQSDDFNAAGLLVDKTASTTNSDATTSATGIQNPPTKSFLCQPNQRQECTTPIKCPGFQTCKEDGSKFGTCQDITTDECGKQTFKIERIGSRVCPQTPNIAIEWERNPNTRIYEIYACEGEGCNPTGKIGESVPPQFIHKNLDQDTVYRYRILSVRTGNRRELSNIGQTKTDLCNIFTPQTEPEQTTNTDKTASKPEREQDRQPVPKQQLIQTKNNLERIRNTAPIEQKPIQKKQLSKELIQELREQPQIKLQLHKQEKKQEMLSKIAGNQLAEKLRKDDAKEPSAVVNDQTISQTVNTLEQQIKAAEKVQIEKIANVIEERGENNQKETITLVTLIIKPPKDIEQLSVYEDIPKTIAESASDLLFYNDNVEVIEDDPLIVWHIPAGLEEVEISYGVKNTVELEQLEQTTTLPVSTQKPKEPEVQQPAAIKEETTNKSKIKTILSTVLIIFIVATVLVFKVIVPHTATTEQSKINQQKYQQSLNRPTARGQQLRRMQYERWVTEMQRKQQEQINPEQQPFNQQKKF